VECGRVDLEGLRADRDQIWAEALAAERAGGPLVLSEKLWGAARELQETRREQDPWEDVLVGLDKSKHCQADKGELRIRACDVIDMELKIPVHQQAGGLSKRVATVMRNLGWDGPKPIRFKIDEITSVTRGYSKLVTGL
jgi:predicted P-loop ATPase